MSAVAPAAIYSLWNKVHAYIPSAELSGIVGDVAHSFGYHLARRDLPGNDYSVQLNLDQQGSSANASALDVSLSPDLMKLVTGRLINAAKKKDPRLRALREFCGTTDGYTTHNYDLSNGYEGFGEWDDSHLWHVHLSFYRAYADNAAALAPIADVMAGKPLVPKVTDPLEVIMSYYTSKAQFEAALRSMISQEVGRYFVANNGDSTPNMVHGLQAHLAHYITGTPYYNDPKANRYNPGFDMRKGFSSLTTFLKAIKTKVGA